MLWNNNVNKGKHLSSEERDRQEILEDVTIQSIIETDYYRKIPFSDYSAVMYEAGHIPGAAMIHLDIKGRSILYTGDFSCQASALTSAYILPDDIYFDTLILCGLHAKHPNQHHNKSMQSQIEYIKQKLDNGIPVHLEVSQLTKGWEVLQTINNKMEQGELPLVPVYIDRQLAYLAEKMEQLHIPVRKQWNHIAVPPSRERCIFIGRYCPASFASIKVDFSLHPGYDDLISFIEKYAPKTVVLVHTGPADDGVDDNCMEREILGKASCPSNLIYAKTGEIYTI
jgi:Cft2 family RNA processing exonuclease